MYGFHIILTIKTIISINNICRFMMLVDKEYLLCYSKFGFVIISMFLKHSKFCSRPIYFFQPYHVSHSKSISKIVSAVLLGRYFVSFSPQLLCSVTSVVSASTFSHVGTNIYWRDVSLLEINTRTEFLRVIKQWVVVIS